MPNLPHAATEPDVIIDGHRIFYVWYHPATTPTHPTHPAHPAHPIRTEADGQVTASLSNPSIPMGMLVEHGRTPRTCIAWVPWVDTDPQLPAWTLLSLVPLSIAEPFTCSNCGLLGGIRNGQWWMGLNLR